MPTENGQQQARQFPNPGQQFPPDQHAGPAPAQNFPPQQPPGAQQTNRPQSQQFSTGMAPAPNLRPSAQSPQTAANQQGAYGLALQPANPPQILYADGELTIVANNSSLADIVGGIERATGARLEGTRPDAERVFGQFGPASPRDVLNSLFDGSRYDFILVGSIDNPANVQKIILSPHGAAPAPGVSTASAQPMAQPGNNEDQDENEPAQVPSEVGHSVQSMPSEATEPAQPPPGQQQQQVKTPEQLLQELQRLRQQQQQQQGQQPQVPR